MINRAIFSETDKEILEFLLKHGDSSASDINRTANSNYYTITRRLKLLQKKGIIKKVIDSNNKRAYLVIYTYNKLKLHDFVNLLG
jgi:DNA-binding MarR family transcriptional regulator